MDPLRRDLRPEDRRQAVLPEKIMGEHPQQSALLTSAVETTQQKVSGDVVLFFTCTNHTHQLLPHCLICFEFLPQSSSVFPDVLEEQLADVFSYVFDHEARAERL